MSRYEFGIMNESDIPCVSRLIENEFEKWVAPTFEQEGHESFRSGLTLESLSKRYKADSIFMVCRCNGKIVGVGEVRKGNHLHALYVDTEYQRKGIGRKILNELIAKIEEIEMTVSAALNAVGVYEAYGFVKSDSESISKGIRYQPMKYLIKKVT